MRIQDHLQRTVYQGNIHTALLKPTGLNSQMELNQKRQLKGAYTDSWRHWGNDGRLAQAIASGNPSSMLHKMLPKLR